MNANTANGEAVPKITRRTLLASASVAVASGAVAHPFASMTTADELDRIIDEYRAALMAWEATAPLPEDSLETDCPEYDHFTKAEWAFIAFPCPSPDVARRKLEFVLDDSKASRSLALNNDADADHHAFYASLLGRAMS